MGLERLKIGVRVRKFTVWSVKTCYRSVWNHPFLVGLVCFLIFLYRSFPLLFSLLVTASPVLVCTAVLLGTLLSFGSPNIPEIDEKEEEEKFSHGVSPLKTGVTKVNTVVERDAGDDDFVVERHVGKRWDEVENADEKVSLVDNEVRKRRDTLENADEKVSLVDKEVGKRWDTVENADEKASLVDTEVSEADVDDGSVRYKPLVNEDLDSRAIHCENGVIDEVERTSNELLVEKKREIQEEMVGSDLLVEKKEIQEEMVGSEGVVSMEQAVLDRHLLANEVVDRNFKVEDGNVAVDSGDMLRGNELDASLVSSWKRFVHDVDDGDDGGDDDDESMDSGSDGAESSSPDASMADIMPMLDELHPLLGIEAAQPAQMSHDGSDAASERSHGSSNDESVESGELENHGEEDNEDEQDEDEGEGAKGNKEDESKSAIKWTEDDQKNLMDLGTSELERNQRLENLIARRRARKSMRLMAEKNLIDLDSADIPLNIAPISTTRCNPFDLPYDSHDDLGLPPIPGSAPSILQPRRNPFDLPYDSNEEKPDLKGDSFEEEFSGFNQRETVSQREAIFRRHESFNVGPSTLGVPRQELKWKPYFVPESLVTEGASPSFQRQSSEVSESKLSSVPDTESVSSVVDEEDNDPNEHYVSQVNELNLNRDHASVHDEQESQSSGDVESVDVEQAENRDIQHDVVEITLGDGESQLEMESCFSEAGATIQAELNANEFQPRTEPVEDDYSSRSSLTSSSEIDEKISNVKGEESAGFKPSDNDIKESGISTQTSFEESDFHFMNRMVDDNQHREPVYDTSPPSVRKFLSPSSVSSDTQAEISEMGSPSRLVESTDKELEGRGETTEQGTSSFEEMHAASSNFLNENEPREGDLPKVCEPDPIHAGPSRVSSTAADHNVSLVPESVVEYVSEDVRSSSSDKGLVENVPNKEERFNQDGGKLSSLGAETDLGVHQGLGVVMGSSPEEQQHPMLVNESLEAEPVEKYAVDKEEIQHVQDEIHSSSSSEGNVVEGTVMPKEEIIQTGCDQIHSSYSEASLDADGQHVIGEELSSMALSFQQRPSPDITFTPEELGHVLMVQVSQVHPPEADPGEEHEKESDIGKVQSSCPDSKIDDTGLSSDINVEGISSNSSYQDVPSGENCSPDSERQVSCSDAAADEPPIHDNDKVEEPSIIASESRGEVNIVNNYVSACEVHDSEDKLSTHFSSITLESTSYPVESPELRLPTDIEDMKYNILNEIESEGPKEIREHFNYAAEAYTTHVDEENISEEVDEIKDIDEGILSELDTVGDFNVKEIGLSEGSHVGYFESATFPEDIKTDANVELPVLEARSVEDINLAFKQLHEGADVKELVLPSMIENQQDHAVTNSKLPVVEARSLEDIHSALQKVPESGPAEMPHSLDLGNASSEVEGHDVVSTKEIEVNNVVSGIQDNSDNAAAEPKNEDRHDLVSIKEIEVSSIVFGIHENGDNAAGKPENEERYHVVSTKETEDGNGVSGIEETGENAAGEQADEEGHDVVSSKEIEVSNLLSGVQEDCVHAAGELINEKRHSTKEIEATSVLSGIQENSVNATSETKSEYKEASEKSSQSISNHKGEKAKSHDSSSGSSSSSSDSE